MKRLITGLLLLLVALSIGCSKQVDNDNQVDTLNLEQVISTIKNNGVELVRTDIKPDKKYIFNGIEPTIYKIKNVKDSYLYVYVFESLTARKQVGSWNTSRISNEIDIRPSMVFTAKNTLLLYVLNKEDYKNFKIIQVIEETTFNMLNESKEVVFKGESEHWSATIKINYFEHFMKDNTAKTSYENYHYLEGRVFYKDKKDDVKTFDYEYDANRNKGGGTGFTLNKDGYSNIGKAAGNGTFQKDGVINLLIKWNGKKETITLKKVN